MAKKYCSCEIKQLRQFDKKLNKRIRRRKSPAKLPEKATVTKITKKAVKCSVQFCNCLICFNMEVYELYGMAPAASNSLLKFTKQTC